MAFDIVKCDVCGLVRTVPLPTDQILARHDLFFYYGKNEHKFIPLLQHIRNELMRLRARHYLSLVGHKEKTLSVLDVGCAEGRLLNAFLPYGCQCVGIEHPSYPCERFIHRDRILYLQGDLKAMTLPREEFDLIFLWHVLEHMDEPVWVLSHLRDLLSREGALILALPNFSSLESIKFKQAWFHLDIPWHKYHFDSKSLSYLAEKHHLRIVEKRFLCLEQGPFGLLQSLFNAMGWPQNEFYEALKGRRNPGRSLPLVFQMLMGIGLFGPVFLGTFLTSYVGRGSVITLALRKV